MALITPLCAEPNEATREMHRRHREEAERSHPWTHGYDGYLTIQLSESGPPKVVLACCPDGEAAPGEGGFVPREIVDSKRLANVLGLARDIGPKIRVNVKGAFVAENPGKMEAFEIKTLEGPWNEARVAVVNASTLGDEVSLYLAIPPYIAPASLKIEESGARGGWIDVWVASSAPKTECVGKATNDWLKWNVRARFGDEPAKIRVRNSAHRYENDRSYEFEWDGSRFVRSSSW